jgi:hypothetical protein
MSDKGSLLLPALKGSCACGNVTYSSRSLPKRINKCHCVTCRKLSGTPFIPFAHFDSKDLSWALKSPDAIRETSSDVAARGFCANCCSQLYMRFHELLELTGVTVGTIDEESVQGTLPSVAAHVFVSQKMKWYEIHDGAKQFERLPLEFQDI